MPGLEHAWRDDLVADASADAADGEPPHAAWTRWRRWTDWIACLAEEPTCVAARR